LANVYGPRDYGRVTTIWLERAAAGEDLVVYGGKQVIDFVTVERVVDAMVRAPKAGLGTQPVNIGSGVGTPILDLATRITRLVPRGSRLDLQPARSVEVERFVADVRRMRALLGLNPPEDPLYALGDMVGSYVRA
jgi:UDP-glucose 4-epimerase